MSETVLFSPRIRAEDLPFLPDDDDRIELVRGELVREPPPGEVHGGVTTVLVARLFGFVHGRRLGKVYTETGFVLESDPDTVRGPDAAFVSAERIERARRRGPYLEGAPDLAVEVLSPSNAAREIEEKVLEYFGAGGRAVWVIDPRTRAVTVHRPNGEPRHLSEDDVLDGAPVLPGFRLPVAKIFDDQ